MQVRRPVHEHQAHEGHHRSRAELPVPRRQPAVLVPAHHSDQDQRGQGKLRVHRCGGHAQGRVGDRAAADAPVHGAEREAELHGDATMGTLPAPRACSLKWVSDDYIVRSPLVIPPKGE